MNLNDTILYLAQVNSRKACPVRSLEDVKSDIPGFEIFEGPMGNLDIRGFGHKGHDNEPRMELWTMYMKHAILPNITEGRSDVKGFYNIELHDSYTYLNNDKDYRNVLTFTKFKDDAGPVVVPDPYMICNWGNTLQNIHDNIPFENKLDKVIFFGTTTGSRNPIENIRLKACSWALDKQDLCEIKITKVAQMTEADIVSAWGASKWKEMYLPRMVHHVEQMKYKYFLDLPGNTEKFDRWNFKTNCLTLKLRTNEMLWYYPMMRAKSEYVEVDDLNRLEDVCDFYNNNHNAAKMIIGNANRLAAELFRPYCHTYYTIKLFESLAANAS